MLPSLDLQSSFIDGWEVTLVGDVIEVAGEGHRLNCYSLSVRGSIDLPIRKGAGDFDVKPLLVGKL